MRARNSAKRGRLCGVKKVGEWGFSARRRLKIDGGVSGKGLQLHIRIVILLTELFIAQDKAANSFTFVYIIY